jgi:hypothetical protein
MAVECGRYEAEAQSERVFDPQKRRAGAEF